MTNVAEHGSIYEPEEERLLRHEPGEERLLRRIGVAVALHWHSLPDNLRRLLLDQAELVSDREGDVGGDELARFLDTYERRAADVGR